MSEPIAVTLAEAAEILKSHASVMILTHTRPDADTLGSAFALREMLTLLGKRAEVANDDDIPKRLRFIADGAERLDIDRFDDFVPEIYVSVDISTSKLLGKYESDYAPKILLAIDHHALGTPFAPNTHVGNVGACGELIFDLALILAPDGSLLTKKVGICLWAAICSDTGSFKFESVTADTHRRIARLLECGFDHSEVARRLYDSRPISQVMATKVALNALHFACENRVAVINFTSKMRIDNDLTREDIDDIISLTRSIEGVELGMSIKQSDDDPTLFKVSMRSNRVVDVSKLCALFGGGGHKRASGCTLNAENEIKAEALLMAAIDEEFKRLDDEHAFDGAGEL